MWRQARFTLDRSVFCAFLTLSVQASKASKKKATRVVEEVTLGPPTAGVAGEVFAVREL
jgi:hypothetical protein